MSIITDIFQPMYGRPCWQVKQGYSSFLTFEFGEPRLHIREPRQASEQATENTRKLAAQRLVYVHGDWRILMKGQEIANNASNRRTINKATLELDDRILTKVTISHSLVSIFEFDLGGRLEVSPNYEEYKKNC